MWWDLARSSLGDSLRELGSSLGTQREIAGKKTGGLAKRLSEYVGNLGNGQLLTVRKQPVPEFSGYGGILAPILKPIWGL
ncbi:hypothetical protein B296_00044075 [Ensete ventricosum]|uniref:Uncharacterized protein n=1 Tax=Ensete ventricosum TaxID=4639 RepID=A0A426Y2V6_ENSVE|nr:hypothetical protein B296_00044075 [Ensete ventricosum]